MIKVSRTSLARIIEAVLNIIKVIRIDKSLGNSCMSGLQHYSEPVGRGTEVRLGVGKIASI